MHIKYFPDTDTLSLDFRQAGGPVAETMDGPDEDVLLDFDGEGRLVALTIEHASKRTALEHLRRQPQFETVGKGVRSEG